MIGTLGKRVKTAALVGSRVPRVAISNLTIENRSTLSEVDVQLVLASTSRYRRALLARLGLPFEVDAPAIDESPRAGEAPRALAARLARAKAEAVAVRWPDALVIGCDQVAHRDGALLGKPGTVERARAQLAAASGNVVEFVTALALLHASSGRCQSATDICRVKFRLLTSHAIERYVALDAPFDCAGAFRSESLGIALVEHMRGDDPSALIGLPLVQLVTLLANEGITPLA